MVWPSLKVFRFSKDNPKGQSERKRRRRRQKKRWDDNIKEWTGMDFASSARAAETGQGGMELLDIHLWCTLDLPRLLDSCMLYCIVVLRPR